MISKKYRSYLVLVALVPFIVLSANCGDDDPVVVADPDAAVVLAPDAAVDPPIYSSCSTSGFPASVSSQIQAKLDEYDLVPGAVVAIYHPNDGYVIKAFGTGNVAGNVDMDEAVVFDVGSVHKVFKWIMLEKLFEDELFDYGDDINDYVASPTIAGGTIYDLTDHSTGMIDIPYSNFLADLVDRVANMTLPGNYDYPTMIDFLENTNTTIDKGTHTETFTNGFRTSPAFTRGADYNYSSFGPLIAIEIAEDVSEGTYLDIIRERVIDEIGLESTTFHGYDELPANLVQGYGNAAQNDASEPNISFQNDDFIMAVSKANGGAIFATTCDMLNFVRAISEPSLGYLKSETISSRTSDPFALGDAMKVGRGLMKMDGLGSGEFWSHAGSATNSHAALIGYHETQDLKVAINVNLNTSFILYGHQLHWDILKIIESAYE